jgi:hypothetical protein
MNPPGFESPFPNTELQQTQPLVRAAAGIDSIEMSGDFSENDN